MQRSRSIRFSAFGGAGAVLAALALSPLTPGSSAAPGDLGLGGTWDAVPASFGLVTQGASTILSRTVLAGLSKATLLGAAAPDARLTIDLVVQHPHQAEETADAQAIYTPGSATYHRYLTPGELATTFGVPAAATQAVRDFATGQGLAVESTSGAGDIVQTTGTVAQLDKAFGVTENLYSSQGSSFIANAAPPSVPSGLHISQVIGLNTVQKAIPADPHVTTAGKPSPAVAGINDGPFTPQNLWSVYDLPDSNKGQGQRAGIFMEGATQPLVSDLRLYESNMKLPQVPVRVVTEGKPGTQTDNLGADEWDLDTDAITGMAPMISSLSYYDAASFYDADLLPDFANWRDDASSDAPLQMNASFGECEQNPGYMVTGAPAINQFNFGLGLGNNTEPAYEMVLMEATMEGRTLFASTGDTAASCPVVILPGVGALNGLNDEAVPLANYPAASKWAVGVGGTDIQTTDATNSTRLLEYGEPTAGGGGSDFIDQQPWMKSVTAMVQPCAVDESGNAYPVGTFCRGLPDVSALYGGQVASGYDTVTNHLQGSGGGTSLSSPLTVGMWTRIQAAAPTRAGLGFAQPEIYALGEGATAANDFYDVTVGTNNYPATPGWDHDSGFGVIDDAGFMKDATGRLTPTFPDAQAAVPDRTTNACAPVIITYAGNANDALGLPGVTTDPSLDITGVDIKTSADAKNLIITMSGPTFSPTLDTNLTAFGADASLTWQYAGKLYYAQESIAAGGGDPTYTDGFVDTSSTFASRTANASPGITGTFVDGLLTMTVPVADVGNPTKGSLLHLPLALVESQELGPVFGAIGIDAGADQDYVVGSVCTPQTITSTTTPVTPAPTTTQSQTPKPAAATVYRTTSLRVGGRGPVTPREKRTYTLRLFVDPGPGVAPSYAGAKLGFFVNGKLRARLVTGKDGIIKYTLKFPAGSYVVSAVYYGTPTLRKSTSPGQKVRSQ